MNLECLYFVFPPDSFKEQILKLPFSRDQVLIIVANAVDNTLSLIRLISIVGIGVR